MIEKLLLKLINKGIDIPNLKTLVIGFTFKENYPDIRNTKTINIIKQLNRNYIFPLLLPLLHIKKYAKKFMI